MSHNKLMTTDNLLQRNVVKPLKCHFCDENESIHHIFFDCVVAISCWGYVKSFNGATINNYFDMSGKWLCETKHELFNNISAGMCWAVWLTRNGMVFRGQVWQDMKVVVQRVWKCMMAWKPMFQGVQLDGINR
jgi:hypothetical protein